MPTESGRKGGWFNFAFRIMLTAVAFVVLAAGTFTYINALSTSEYATRLADAAWVASLVFLIPLGCLWYLLLTYVRNLWED
jgi:hypothetical protein